jgi:CRP/FNR family transcriptional regulator, anaerobic regulatory protein
MARSATLLCFPAVAVQLASKASPLLASRLITLTTQSVSDIHDVLALQTHYPACERFSAYLLALFNRNPLRTKSREILELPTSRREIAELLGIGIDTMARSIRTLQDHGTLRVHSARLLELIDRARLESTVLMRHRRTVA